jgi:hypothetical protein
LLDTSILPEDGFFFVFLWAYFCSIDEKRGDVSPVGATAFAFEIVKSPYQEFTHSDFTISTTTGRRYIPAKTIIDRNSKEAAHKITYGTAPFLGAF